MTETPTPPALTWLASIDVRAGPPMDIGATADSVHRVVPIRG